MNKNWVDEEHEAELERERIRMHEEEQDIELLQSLFESNLTEQLLEEDMISTDDFFPSSEEELFRQIQEDERHEFEDDI
jgi:hypothetical protein